MTDEVCTECGRTLAEGHISGCDQCDLDYDPLQPEYNEVLDFDSLRSKRSLPEPDNLIQLDEYEQYLVDSGLEEK